LSSIENRKAELELEAKFQNGEFEKNISQTMKSLDSFEKSLNSLGGQSVRGIEQLNKSFDSLNTMTSRLADTGEFIQRRFSVLGTAITNIMTNTVEKVMLAGAKMMSSLTVDNIKVGWEKFGEDTKNIGTIIAQGYDMRHVEEQMKRLMFFTDETSYSYNDMVGNISKFTAAGQKLDDAVQEMQGIALWAGSAGVSAQKASIAMYQLSQAMGNGFMRKEDWKSIQNLNMDTVEFRKQALEAAVELKRLKKVGEDTYQSLVKPKEGPFKTAQFAEHLTNDKWFDSKVMKKVYTRYAEAVNQIYEYVEEHGVSTTTAIEKLEGTIDPLALKWFKASQEARTFGDAIEYVKEAVSTTWLRTFQLIFGNYEEATKLWTDFTEVLYEVFVRVNETRNEILELWKDMGGRDELLLGISEAFESLKAILAPVKEAFEHVFPPAEDLREPANMLLEMTRKFTDLMVDLRISDETAELIKTTFIGVFSVIRSIIKIIGTFANKLKPLAKPLNLLLGIIADLISQVGKAATEFSEWLDTSKDAEDLLNRIGIAAGGAIAAFAGFKAVTTVINRFKSALQTATTVTSSVITSVSTVVTTIKNIMGIVGFFAPILAKILLIASALFVVHKLVIKFFGSWENLIAKLQAGLGVLQQKFQAISEKVGAFVGNLVSRIQNAKRTVLTFFNEFAKSIDLSTKIDAAKKKFTDFLKNAQNFVNLGWSAAKSGFASAVTFIQHAFTDLPGTIRMVKEEAKQFFDITNPDSGISRAILEIQTRFTQLQTVLGQVKDSVINFFVGLYNSVKGSDTFKSIHDSVIDMIRGFDGINTVTGLLKRFGDVLGNIAANVTPRFGAFGEIIGKIFSDLSKIFSNLASNFNFRGVVTTLIDLFFLLGNTIQNVISKFIPPLSAAATAIGNFFNNILSKAGGFDTVMKNIGSALGIVGGSMDKLKGHSSRAMTATNGFFKFITQGVKAIQQGFSEFTKETGTEEFFNGVTEWLGHVVEYIKQLKPSQVLLFVFGLAVVRFAISFSSAMNRVSNSIANTAKAVTDTITTVTNSVNNLLNTVTAGIGGFFGAMKKLPEAIITSAKEIKKAILGHNMARDFLRVAAGITMLAISFGLLAKFVDPEKLDRIAAIMFVFMASMVFAIQQLSNIDAASMAGKASVMLALAVSLALIAATIGIVSKDMDPDKLSRLALGLGMVGLIAYLMYQALKMFATIPVNAAAAVGPILALAAAINLIAIALAVLIPVVSLVGIGGTLGALGILGVFLIGIAKIANIAAKISAKAFLPILGITASLYLLLGAILLIAISPLSFDLIKKNWEKFAIMIIAVVGILVGIGISAKIAGGVVKGIGLAFIGIAASVNQISKAMVTLSKIKFDSFGHWWSTMATFWTVFIAAVALMHIAGGVIPATIKFGIAMIAIAAAMRLMVVAMDAIRAITEKTSPLQMAGIVLVFAIVSAVIGGLMFVSRYTRGAKLAPIALLIGAIGLLMVAVSLMSQLPNIGKMVAIAFGLAAFFAGVGFCFAQVAQASKVANPGVMAAFAIIVAGMCATLWYLAQQDWQKTIAAGGAMALAAAGIGLGIFLIGQAAKAANGALAGAGAIVLASLSLVVAAGALLMLKDYPVENLAVKALALGTIFAIMAVASQYATLGLVGAGALVIASASLAVAAFSLMLLKDFPAESIGPAALALSGILIGLAFAATFASVAILGAVALDIASLSLVSAATALSMLASYPAEEVSQNAMSLIVILAALAAAGFVASLPNVALGLVAVSGAMLAFALSVAIIASAASTFADAVQRVIGSILSLGDISSERMGQITENMSAIGMAVGESVANAITSFFSNLFHTIDEATGGILTKLSNAANQMASAKTSFEWVGSELNNGLRNGIQNGIGEVVGAMETLGHKALEAFQNVVGVHSESSVMHWIGDMLDLGAKNGITEGIPGVSGAMDSLGANVIDAAKGYFNFGNGQSLGSSLVNGIMSALGGLPEWIKSKLGDGWTNTKAFFGDEEAKAKVEEKRRQNKITQQAERQRRARQKYHERLEKEKNKDKDEDEDDPFANLGKGGGGGGGGGGSAEKAKETAQEIDKLTNILDYANKTVGIFNTHWALTEDNLSRTDAFRASKDAVELLALQLYDASIASETAEDAAKRMAKSQAEVAADIKKAYLDVRNGIVQTLQGQIDLFEMADFGEKVKGGDLLERAKSQERLAVTFGQSFETLTERVAGLDGAEKLLRHFTDEGYSSMGELSSVLDMTADELKEFVGLADKYYGSSVYENAADRMMADMAYVGYKAAGGFSQGLDPESGEVAAETFANATLEKLRQKFGVNLQGDNTSEVTRAIGEGLANGINSSLVENGTSGQASAAGEKLGANVTSAVETSISKSSGEEIGKNLCEGIAKGIEDNTQMATGAAESLGKGILETINNTLGIHSPSEEFENKGYRSVQGLAIGFTKNAGLVYAAVSDLAQSALTELGEAFNTIGSYVDNAMNLNPTITPVLDLDNLQYGSSMIGSLLGIGDPYALNAVARISSAQNDNSLIASLENAFKNAVNTLKGETATGDIIFHIYPTENQDPNDIADAISYKINHDVLKKSAAKGGN